MNTRSHNSYTASKVSAKAFTKMSKQVMDMPRLIAVMMKRSMIADTGSTSSSGTAGPSGEIVIRSRTAVSGLLFTCSRYSA